MGLVYKARDLGTGRPVALKIARCGPNDDDDVDAARRCAREAEILAALAHPNIVTYVTHGYTADHAPYLAMEWLDGQSLEQRIQRTPPSEAQAVELAIQICGALAAVHGQGIVHRDVKPANIFLVSGRTEQVKLIDFGVAHLDARMDHAIPDAIEDTTPGFLPGSACDDRRKARLGARGDTMRDASPGVIVGTPEFLAPEQATGAPVDARTDLYALGAVLFACMTRRPPFRGNHSVAVLAKLLFEPIPRVRDIRPDVSLGLDALITRLMSREPELRPASATEVLAALVDLARETPRRSGRAPTRPLSKMEQRFFSVLLVGDQRAARSIGHVYESSLGAPLMSLAARYKADLHCLAGGALVALFPSQRTPIDAAMRAARCALALRPLLPGAGMAIATGRGLCNAMPAGETLVGEAPVGEAIDRAVNLLFARGDTAVVALESLPEEADSDIALDDVTAGLLQHRARIHEARDDRGACYVLLGARRQRSTAYNLLGKPTRCVGREHELATLATLLDACQRQSVARAVLVTGPAGAGKSRLAHELLRRLGRHAPRRDHDEQPAVWMAWCDSMQAGAAFAVLGQLIRQAFGIAPDAPPRARQWALDQHLRRVAGHLAEEDIRRVAVFLGELIGARFAHDAHWLLAEARHEPMLMYEQTRTAWEDWLDAETRHRAILLVIEDLHWCDAPTVDFLGAALRNLAHRPIMALALAEPQVEEAFPALWDGRDVQRIALSRLGEGACEELVRQVVPAGLLGDDAVRRLVARSGGHPFYLEELVRGVAHGHSDALPDSVLALVSARLQDLPEGERRVLRAASVFGRTFWIGGVAALLGEAPARVHGLAARLAARELIVGHDESRLPGQVEYAFHHELTQGAAYATLTDEDGASAHRFAGAWLEKAGERNALILAEHYWRGQDRLAALPWYQAAAEQSLQAGDMRAVIEHAGRALACGASGRDLGRLHRLQAEACNWRKEHELARLYATQAMRMLLEDSAGWAVSAHHAVWAAAATGDAAEIRAITAQVYQSAVRYPDEAHLTTLARCAVHLVVTCQEPGGALRIQQLLEQHLDGCSASLAATVWHMRSFLAAFDGDLGGAAAALAHAVRLWDAAGKHHQRCLDQGNLGTMLCDLGLYDEGLDALRTALVTAERLGIDHLRLFQSDVALVLARRGDTAQAREILCKLRVDLGEDAREGAYLAIARARVALLDRDPAAALDETMSALQAIGDSDSFAHARAYALAVRARACLMLDKRDAALACARTAFALAEACGSLEQGDAFARLIHAEALHAVGRHGEARDAIARARRRLLEQAARMEEPRWRRSFLTRVDENQRTLALAEAWQESGRRPAMFR